MLHRDPKQKWRVPESERKHSMLEFLELSLAMIVLIVEQEAAFNTLPSPPLNCLSMSPDKTIWRNWV
jgi:hypothetical protein